MKPTNPDRIFLTPSQLAARWALAEFTIRQWAREGRLPFATKIGGAWRFPLDRVEAYEKRQMVGDGRRHG